MSLPVSCLPQACSLYSNLSLDIATPKKIIVITKITPTSPSQSPRSPDRNTTYYKNPGRATFLEQDSRQVRLQKYFSYLEDINFIFLIRKYGKGVREVEGTIPKIYLVDLRFVILHGVEDRGRRIEKIFCDRIVEKKALL